MVKHLSSKQGIMGSSPIVCKQVWNLFKGHEDIMAHYHPYHLVDASPWPYLAAMSALSLTMGTIMWFQGYLFGELVIVLGLVSMSICSYVWWRDIVREGTYQGHHTWVVQKGLTIGMVLFIVSEVFFFISFFWAFFHSSLAPTAELGGVWPPVGIQAFNPFQVPLLNTVILLSSGATVTWSHHALLARSRADSLQGLIMTVALGLVFTCLQAYEYVEASFTIADSVYGSIFYLTTGFHGLHVIIGTIFLIVCLVRLYGYHFTQYHHFGFEAASWYWHFVDVVWLFVFTFYYWWGY